MAFHAELSENTVDKCMYITFGLILFSVIFERSLHTLEQWIHVFARYYVDTLNVVYKELMMLGIISLFLTMLTSLVEDEYWSLSFEFVHLSLFISSMLHIVFTVSMVIFGVKWCRFWKFGERQGLQIIESNLELLELKDDWKTMIQNPRMWLELNCMRWKRDYLIVREVFIWQNDLPTAFDFTMYIRKRVRATVRHLVVIHYSVWVILLCLLMISLLVYKAEMRSGQAAFMTAAWVNCALAIILWVKSKEMLRKFIQDHKSIHGRRTMQIESLKAAENIAALRSLLEQSSLRESRILQVEGHVQREIFWLRSPSAFRNSLQFVLFFHSLWFAVYCLYWAERFESAMGHVSAFLPLLIIAFMTVRILPVFALMSSVGCLTDQESLMESLSKQSMLQGEKSKKSKIPTSPRPASSAHHKAEIPMQSPTDMGYTPAPDA
eukprot:TRINITY_DN409_c0_g1_i2.p1 TRINITY_DN409_c0_g1~~TRINITY_DN409_c0_g1_i2.p1  ORF type:complete len:436 (+),score=81.93 TRINITY_DN409_c0_g1_i2:63-1370(+)